MISNSITVEVSNSNNTRVLCRGCLKTFASKPNLNTHQLSCESYKKNQRIEELENELRHLKDRISVMYDCGRRLEYENKTLKTQINTMREEGRHIINGLQTRLMHEERLRIN